ncbi:hypothetical protein AUTU_02540 [Aureibacter tunicatorum]|nr:hypothetical protein AUTU_02540 [Aureibacter tunicatorum]
MWALVILFLTLIPGQHLPEMVSWNLLATDKLAHSFVFMILTLLAIIGFLKQGVYPWLKQRAEWVAVAGAFVYGGFIELMQSFIPNRSFEFQDMIANGIGCLLGYAVYLLIYKV